MFVRLAEMYFWTLKIIEIIVALPSEHSPQTPAYASTQRSKKSSGIYISPKYSAHNRYQNMEI